MGDLTAKDMLIFGAFVPAPQSSAWLTLQLATEELGANGGLMDATGARRPVVTVACDPQIATLEPAANHLLEELGVAGIVTSSDEALLSAALNLPVTRDSAAVMVSTRGSALSPSSDATQLLWQLGAPASSATRRYPEVIRGIEQALSARLDADRRLRAVSLVSEAREDVEVADAVDPSIELQEARWPQLVREDRHRRLTLPDAPLARSSVLAELIAYAPDLLLIFAGGYFGSATGGERSSVVWAIEEAAAETGWRPVYLLGPANVADASPRALARESASFRARAVGIASAPAFDSELSAALTQRFYSAFPNSSVDPSALTYDALYQLAYGATASQRTKEPPMTRAIEGQRQIADRAAPSVIVGPGLDGLDEATRLLAAGAPLNLIGITGPAPGAERERAPAPGVYCFALLPTGNDELGIELAFDTDAALGGLQCAEEALQ